jgi:hypothetical protein
VRSSNLRRGSTGRNILTETIDTGLRICADCGLIDESVTHDEDNDCFLCPACLYDLDLMDWADEIMEEFGWTDFLVITEDNRSHKLGGNNDRREDSSSNIAS